MKSILSLILILVFQFGYAQLKVNPNLMDGIGDNLSSSVTVGTSFGNGYNSSFLAPNISQTLGQKLTLNYGGIFSTGSGDGVFINQYGFGQVAPASSNTFYINGSYKLSNRLTFISTVAVENGEYSGINSDMNNFNNNMVRMGFEYKISENVRLQAEFGMHQGNHPYSGLFNPYNQSPYQRGISPFYSPFLGY